MNAPGADWKDGRLAPSELVLLDSLILRAWEQGRSVEGLWVDTACGAVKASIDCAASAAAEGNLASATSAQPAGVVADEDTSHDLEAILEMLLLEQISAGADVARELEAGLTTTQLRQMRRQLRVGQGNPGCGR